MQDLIFKFRYHRYYRKTRFFIGNRVSYLINFLVGLVGYTYSNAQYSSSRDVSISVICGKNAQDIADQTTVIFVPKNDFGYGLVRRLKGYKKISESVSTSERRKDGSPAQYWEFGRYMILPKREV